MGTLGGRSLRGALAVLAIAIAMPVASAWALEPGVQADPGSPAEKQYVLPLNQARQTGGGSSPATSSPPHLFGAGITPPGGGGSGGATTGGAGSGAASTGSASPTVGTRGAASAPATHVKGSSGASLAPTTAVLRAARSPDSSGDGSLLALLGGGVAVLALGAFGGTVLRHSRRPNPSG